MQIAVNGLGPRIGMVADCRTELQLRPGPNLLPALMGSLRVGMGAGIGALFGAVTENLDFWIVVGLVLGGALGSIAARQNVAPVALDPGVYRVGRC